MLNEETITAAVEKKTSLPELHEETLKFKKLQADFKVQFENFFPDKQAPKTVVIIPSLTMDTEILSKVSGITHYEERLLCMLLLLPHT